MVIVGLGISPPWGQVSERASANCLSVKQNEGVFTLTLNEVLRGSPDVEPSLGAAVDPIRGPLAPPPPPPNDKRVVGVVAVMVGGRCWRIEMGYSWLSAP